MKSWFAGILAVIGLGGVGSAPANAASPDCAVVGGQLLSWPTSGTPVWEMCWLGPGQSVGPRGSGLELRAVHYNGILVAKKIHSPLLFAEYTHGVCYRDWMNDDTPSLAPTVTHNQLGTPPNANRLAVTSCSVSTHPTQSFGICSFGQTPQPGEACTTGQNVVIGNMGDHLTIVSQYRADWYMYDSRISFYQNGDIDPTFGFGNHDGTENGTTHWHHNYWRFDFDIDEAGNNMLTINDADQATEFTSVRGAPGSTSWSVRNTVSGRGYRLQPGTNDYNVTPNQSGHGYHNVDVMGLRFNSGEIDDLGAPSLSDCTMHHNNVVNGQSIANQDVVLWYHGAVRDSTANNWPPGCSGASCIPQDSMVCKTAGPRLVQFGDWGMGGKPQANLNQTMTATPNPVGSGEQVTLSATVANAGPDPATSVVYTIVLPDGLSFQSASPASWTCTDVSSTVSCNLAGDLASGSSAPVLDVVALVANDASGTVAATSMVTASEEDTDTTDNDASVDIVILGEDDLIFANGFESAGPAECEPLQLLEDPGFETTTGNGGSNGSWDGTDSNGGPDGTPFYDDAAFNGSFGAWGGGWRAAGTQTWSQSVTIPAGNPRFLNFWRNVDVAPAGGTASLKAFVDGEEVSTFDPIANGVDDEFVSMSVDVSEYADGGKHEIEFIYSTVGVTNDGNVFVDDVTLECEALPAVARPAARHHSSDRSKRGSR